MVLDCWGACNLSRHGRITDSVRGCLILWSLTEYSTCTFLLTLLVVANTTSFIVEHQWYISNTRTSVVRCNSRLIVLCHLECFFYRKNMCITNTLFIFNADFRKPLQKNSDQLGLVVSISDSVINCNWVRSSSRVYNSHSVSIHTHKVSNPSESLLGLPFIPVAIVFVFTFRLKRLR